MLHFTCNYCEKQINDVTIVVDETIFLHSTCLNDYKKNKLVKWDSLSKEDKRAFLKKDHGHTKEDLINLNK